MSYGNNNANDNTETQQYNDYSDVYVAVNTTGDFEEKGQISDKSDMALLRQNYGSVQLNETVRYANDKWIKQIYTNAEVTVKDIKADNNGNVYMCGYVTDPDSDTNVDNQGLSSATPNKHFAGHMVKGTSGFILKMDYNKNIKWVHMERPIKSIDNSDGSAEERKYNNRQIQYHALDISEDGYVYAVGKTENALFIHNGNNGTGAMEESGNLPEGEGTSTGDFGDTDFFPFITKLNLNGVYQDYAYIPSKNQNENYDFTQIIADSVNNSIYVLGETTTTSIGLVALNTGLGSVEDTIQFAGNFGFKAPFCSKLSMNIVGGSGVAELEKYVEGSSVSTNLRGKYWDCPIASSEANTWFFVGDENNNTRTTSINEMILNTGKLWFVGATKNNLIDAEGDVRADNANGTRKYGILTCVDVNSTNQLIANGDGANTAYTTKTTGHFWEMSRKARVWDVDDDNVIMEFRSFVLTTEKCFYITGNTNTNQALTVMETSADTNDSFIWLGKIDVSLHESSNPQATNVDTDAVMIIAEKNWQGGNTQGTIGFFIRMDEKNNLYLTTTYKNAVNSTGLVTQGKDETDFTELVGVPGAVSNDLALMRFSAADSSTGAVYSWAGAQPSVVNVTPSGGNTSLARMSLSQFVPCLLEGTIIKTDQGSFPIEELTLNNTIRGIQIEKITKNKVNKKHICKIPKNWFDLNKPNKDTYITKSHNICIENEKKFPKGFKRAGSFDCGNLPINLETELCTVYHISFGNKHSYYYANNLPAESLNPYFNKRY